MGQAGRSFRSPERAASPKRSPGCRRRASARRRNPGDGPEEIMSPERTVLGGNRKAETRIRFRGNRPESGLTKLPDRSALRTELGWDERPFRTCFLFWRRPRVASLLAALVSTPPLGWVKRAAPSGLLGKVTAQRSGEPADTTEGRMTEKKTVPFPTLGIDALELDAFRARRRSAARREGIQGSRTLNSQGGERKALPAVRSAEMKTVPFSI